MTHEEALKILEPIVKSFPPGSKESEALEFAAEAVLFIFLGELKDQFEEYINSRERPLTGMEIIKLKVYGLEIPEEYKTPEIAEIESEIDALASKIVSFMPKMS